LTLCEGVVRFTGVVLLAVTPWFDGILDAQSSNTREEFWPELDAYVRLNEKSRLFFQYSATREKDLMTKADGQIGGFLDVYMLPVFRRRLREDPDASRDKFLMFRVGYAYSPTPSGSSTPSTEHIPTIAATGRAPLPWGSILSDRNRGDLRFVNGVFTPRYRNRLRIERTVKQGRFLLTPYIDAEVFYDWRYDAFNEFRYSAGMNWSVARFLAVEGYYTRERDTKSSPEYVNAAGVKVQFYFRGGKK
jgi:Protein of unknown function (DUF2490)